MRRGPERPHEDARPPPAQFIPRPDGQTGRPRPEEELMLTIFDCDGVLIDLEILVCEAAVKLFAAEGYEISREEAAMRFIGGTTEAMIASVEADLGRSLPEDFLDTFRVAVADALGRVRPIPGMADLLDKLDGPRCVCSNSSSARLRASLSTAGLWDRVKPYVFSATEVGSRRGKPAPDVYLYAASEFSVAPGDTVVIEDLPSGVAAAVAAGMRVIGFTGASHVWLGLSDQLTDAGAETVVRRARDIPAVIEAFASWKGLDA